MKKRCRIGVVAPASRMSPEVAVRVPTLARALYPDSTPENVFHPQCFASHGHFAGDDETRARAFLDIANDESHDVVWFARGGYGACRMVEAVMAVDGAVHEKPTWATAMPVCCLRPCTGLGSRPWRTVPWRRTSSESAGDAAVERALAWMVDPSPEALEPTVSRAKKTAAFNMTVLSQIPARRCNPTSTDMCSCWRRWGRQCTGLIGRYSTSPVRRNQAGVGRDARPLQRHHLERTGFRNERRRDRPILVPEVRVSMVGTR